MLHVIKHPLIDLKLNKMRDEKTNSKDFRFLLNEIASLMTYEVFRDLTLHVVGTRRTPTGVTIEKVRLDKNIVICPILRAGIGMSTGVQDMLPMAKVGHIGLYRDEKTLQPHEYYCKMPVVENPLVLICDPMLATGGSACDAICALNKRGFKEIRLLCLVGAPEGIKKVEKEHPEVEIYLAAVDEKLNDKGYILPGLGDAGDRIFGTL
ncbi:MAG: uracil phosphoribosyltransferase [Bacilli bacterium]